MKAVALNSYLPIADPLSLVDVDILRPVPGPRDLLVHVEAISVNPVDTKVRRSKPGQSESEPRVLGWDVAGTVKAIGSKVSLFRPGDEIYYAGSIMRPGANAEFHCVDERLVGNKPASLSFAEAAALPLTAITAWEALFDRLQLDVNGAYRGRSILIIGGAGGVGSIGIQLAKIAGLTVITTAGRPETRAWCESMGADHVVDHSRPLPAQLAELGFKEVDFIANFADTDAYWSAMAELIRPQGRIVGIVGNVGPLDLDLLKSKSASFVWEFMFTRAMYGTADMQAQHDLLDTIADLVASGRVRTTLTETISPINAANLRAVHERLESGRTIGKIVLSGWS